MLAREIQENELNKLLELYTHLHETGVPEQIEKYGVVGIEIEI
jgi:hypothetical protein